MVTVVITQDAEFLRAVVNRLTSATKRVYSKPTVADAIAFARKLEPLPPVLMIVDGYERESLRSLVQFRESVPSARIIAVVDEPVSDAEFDVAAHVGAEGFVPKTAMDVLEEVLLAIREEDPRSRIH
jgi:hypothetical protein